MNLKRFNQMVLYGKDVNEIRVHNAFPMMAEHQVIVKEVNI
jgi:hypothetical protein